ncbi:hypothetical protein [Leptolyngbya sp. FACHB-16]|uniref:hypothetical protein n=1 Tax=unclassified Leptolyngbya TaxID=2650499 RepID=UPI0016845610|nr:hypothetical protein [Leptolyngbya sp. FACHB-16]
MSGRFIGFNLLDTAVRTKELSPAIALVHLGLKNWNEQKSHPMCWSDSMSPQHMLALSSPKTYTKCLYLAIGRSLLTP